MFFLIDWSQVTEVAQIIDSIYGSDPYTCPFFVLPTHKLRPQNVHSVPDTSHPLTGAIVTRQSVLFTSPVRGYIMVDR